MLAARQPNALAAAASHRPSEVEVEKGTNNWQARREDLLNLLRLGDENAQLLRRNEELCAQVGRLVAENAALRAENAELQGSTAGSGSSAGGGRGCVWKEPVVTVSATATPPVAAASTDCGPPLPPQPPPSPKLPEDVLATASAVVAVAAASHRGCFVEPDALPPTVEATTVETPADLSEAARRELVTSVLRAGVCCRSSLLVRSAAAAEGWEGDPSGPMAPSVTAAAALLAPSQRLRPASASCHRSSGGDYGCSSIGAAERPAATALLAALAGSATRPLSAGHAGKRRHADGRAASGAKVTLWPGSAAYGQAAGDVSRQDWEQIRIKEDLRKLAQGLQKNQSSPGGLVGLAGRPPSKPVPLRPPRG